MGSKKKSSKRDSAANDNAPGGIDSTSKDDEGVQYLAPIAKPLADDKLSKKV
jgi:hypothetical protein